METQVEKVRIAANAELITTFHSHHQWVQKASSRLGGYAQEQKILCLDVKGNTLTIGKDFAKARDNNLFPVKAYRMIRTSEIL